MHVVCMCGEVKRDLGLVYTVSTFVTDTQFTYGIFGKRRKTFVIGETRIGHAI